MDSNNPNNPNKQLGFFQRYKLPWYVKYPLIVILLIGGFLALDHFGLIPGTTTSESKKVGNENKIDKKQTQDVFVGITKTPKKEVPNFNNLEEAETTNRPEVRMMNWIWFGNAGIFTANGGPVTMKNSFMDQKKLNLKLITNNSVTVMKNEQATFIKAYYDGEKYPKTGVALVSIMGDGAVTYISSMNQAIREMFGDKKYKDYRVKIVGIVGWSLGEDCVMGPDKWKTNPKSMEGCIISAVYGDGDWLLGIRFGSDDNGVLVNPDPGTYDPKAINFVPAPDDNFLEAANDVIAGKVVKLQVKDSNGKLTGDYVEKQVEGAATWFPGDRRVVENTDLIKVTSTTDYPNQMATVIVGCDKWCRDNEQWVVDFLSASLTATNQIKQYDEWFQYATQLAPSVFCMADPVNCTETAEDWYNYGLPHYPESVQKERPRGFLENRVGTRVSIGGTLMATLEDNKKYFGIGAGKVNFYKSIYNYSKARMEELNPMEMVSNIEGGLTPYEDAVDTRYLEKVNVESIKTPKVDYTKNTGVVFGTKDWGDITYNSNSATLTSKGEKEVQALFDLINGSEYAKVQITGHTDDVGDEAQNQELSLARAYSVRDYLMKLSNNTFDIKRFIIEGKGESEPKVPGTSADARSQNRRVTIKLLK